MNRTFQESLRFPAPEHTVNIVVRKRDTGNVFPLIDSERCVLTFDNTARASPTSTTPPTSPTCRPPIAQIIDLYAS